MQRATELGWGPSRHRLEALAGEPAMQAQIAMLGLQRRIAQIGDEQAKGQLDAMWQPAWQALSGTVNNAGYTDLETGALLSVATQPQQGSEA